MSLSLAQTLTAIGAGLTSSFLASGGTQPYSYSVRPNGAGGTINSSTGIYTAPSNIGPTPKTLYDTIVATDSSSPALQATSQILVAQPLILLCDVIQTVMGLAPGRVYLWDQKIFQPSDSNLFIVAQVLTSKCFGNTITYDTNGNQIQNSYMNVQVQIDVKSRSTEALFRKDEVIQALNSSYSQQQQEANSFRIFPLPGNVTNLSEIDGAAIPYRFSIPVRIQYTLQKITPVPYFNTFEYPTVYTQA